MAKVHTTGTRRPNGERVGAPEDEGAGIVRMAGHLYENPQAKRTKMNPAGGNFGVGNKVPKNIPVEREGE